MTSTEPTVRRQELGAELRNMRKKSGYTLEDAAKVINVSPSLVSRIETGHRSVSPVDVASLLGFYQADPGARDRLLALAGASHEVGWWQRDLTDVREWLHTLITLESKAESIVSFEFGLIPGLLQTGEYARAVISECGYVPDHEIENHMLTRLRRQSVLSRREPPELLVIIDELALHRVVGGRDVLRRQWEHLVQESKRPNVTVHVVPNDGRAHGGIEGSFLILRRPGYPPVVYVETLTSGLFLETRAEVDMYELVHQNLLNRALDAEQSVEYVASLARRLNTEASNGWTPPTYML